MGYFLANYFLSSINYLFLFLPNNINRRVLKTIFLLSLVCIYFENRNASEGARVDLFGCRNGIIFLILSIIIIIFIIIYKWID